MRTPERPAMASEDLIRRVRGEFYEMPGLRLTVAQASRLWQLDETTCEAILASLAAERVLSRSADGYYTLLPLPRSARAMSERSHA
jgi:hypothetical protein